MDKMQESQGMDREEGGGEKKEGLLVKMLKWIARGTAKASETGAFCNS